MSEAPKRPDRESGLSPALRRRTERLHDTRPTPPPADSASVQREEGRAWPMIWLIVTAVCIAIGIWLIFF